MYITTINKNSNENIEYKVVSNLLDYSKKNIVNLQTHKYDRQYIKFKRYLHDKTMAIETTYVPYNKISNFSYEIRKNNSKILFKNEKQILEEESFSTFTFIPSQESAQIDINKIKELEFISFSGGEILINTKVDFYNDFNLSKNYFVDEKGIQFKTLKALHLSTFASHDLHNDFDKIFYNNIVFIPIPLKPGKHNKILYKVLLWNDIYEEEALIKDFDIKIKQIGDLPIFNNEKLEAIFVKKKDDEVEYINGKKVVGTIEISDKTYYDNNKKNTIKSFNSNSEKGYIIPYNFKGKIFPKLSLSLNSDFEDINLFTKQEISQEFFNKTEGKIKLRLKVEKNYVLKPKEEKSQHFRIWSSNFSKIIKESLPLKRLEELEKDDEDEE